MDKLIITCATAWDGYQAVEGLHLPKTALEIAESMREARDAGAAIAHVHQALTAQGPSPFQMDAWLEVARLTRERTDIVFEHGLGGRPFIAFEHNTVGNPPGNFDIALEKPELIAVILNEVDFAWSADRHFYTMPTRAELAKHLRRLNEHGVKPAFEVWHGGSFFNLQWLIDQQLLSKPYWLTLFFGANGGMSGPATIDELLHRVKAVPPEALWQVGLFCGVKGTATTRDQMALVAHSIALGGHVRIGMEDNPYYWDGVPAESNAQLVERVVRIARDLGREVATPDEARRILGLGPR